MMWLESEWVMRWQVLVIGVSRALLLLTTLLLTPLVLLADPLSKWSWRSPLAQGYALEGVTYATGKFFAVGDLNTILVSTNGNDWTSVRSGVPGDLYSLAFGNGNYVAVGSAGEILVSTNGETWENRPSATSNTLFGVTFGNGVFVAVGGQGTVVTSSNGRDWVLRFTLAPTSFINDFLAVAYGNWQFVAVPVKVVIDNSLESVDSAC